MPNIDPGGDEMTLRDLRKQKGLTLRALGDQAGLDLKTIWRYEQGLFTPKWTNAKKLAAALGVDVTVIQDTLYV